MFLVAKDTPTSMAYVAQVLMWLLGCCPSSPGDYELTGGWQWPRGPGFIVLGLFVYLILLGLLTLMVGYVLIAEKFYDLYCTLCIMSFKCY
jgi:hypothetical protein